MLETVAVAKPKPQRRPYEPAVKPPCPFCGCTAPCLLEGTAKEGDARAQPWACVTCPDCLARGPKVTARVYKEVGNVERERAWSAWDTTR